MALKGLQLAANDAERGVIGPEQLEQIKESVQDLVGDLDRHKDAMPELPAKKGNADVPTIAEQNLPAPRRVPDVLGEGQVRPEWRHPGAVLCIAGRGPLDSAAATILAQLVAKHGVAARMVPYEQVSRRGIETLELDGVEMVCIAYLQVKGSPSHLRYLLQRLRDRLPRQKLLVGLWPEGDATLSDREVQRSLGADLYVGTLAEAVGRCIEEAREPAREDTRETAAA